MNMNYTSAGDLLRAAVGFEHILFPQPKQSKYPPHNIEVIDDEHYLITIAVAGFSENEITVTSHDQERKLVVSGVSKSKNSEKNAPKYIYQGIAKRDFTHTFELAEHLEVEGADMKNGILSISLQKHTPEEEKPRNVKINSQ